MSTELNPRLDVDIDGSRTELHTFRFSTLTVSSLQKPKVNQKQNPKVNQRHTPKIAEQQKAKVNQRQKLKLNKQQKHKAKMLTEALKVP